MRHLASLNLFASLFLRTAMQPSLARRLICCRHGSGFSPATAIAATLLLALPSVASADWLIAGYIGAVHTLSTTLHLTPDRGAAFDLPEVEFRGESCASPSYYGYRLGWR